ncbi:MAG: GAF and ANTAR domain-containing protein, partial [Actinomycetota bacterium]|nr:GAF and ANTAR domain-containing protein [Actinomycetota bacterium]
LLHTLTLRCVDLLDAAEVGLMLADLTGELRVIASSSERAHLLKLFELQNEEGPCLDCYRSGQPVVNESLEADQGRWPSFVPAARAAGFRSVHALPMRLRSQVVGALNLFRSEPGRMSDADLAAAQALADIATISILQERAVGESKGLTRHLEGALNSRVAIEQAKGVLAERGDLSMDAAFDLIRTFARSHNRRLHDLAIAVVEGGVDLDELTGVSEASRARTDA